MEIIETKKDKRIISYDRNTAIDAEFKNNKIILINIIKSYSKMN